MTLLSSMRSNTKRNFSMENHKRGRSLDSGLTLKAKDDDLVLFSDMQMRESENFLLNSGDDFDESLFKLKHVSDFKLHIPVLGEGSDILNAGSEKNDYDWLLTPPETPLFSSLDDEELQSTCSVSRGRSQAHTIETWTSSSTGKGQRTGRISATTPSQLGNKQFQGRGRASSARSASPASVLRSTTPSRRSITPTPRSSTPTHRRTSSGSSSSVASFGKSTRGSSSSPSLRGYLINFPDLSSEVPPNLRTSISGWAASCTRESSPCRNGSKMSGAGRHGSRSPSASRSVSSSQSNDRDHFSSSCDDDMDFTYSMNPTVFSRPSIRKYENLVGGKSQVSSRKPLSPGSSFGQMHQRKAPQNKFRPLLSSVPPSSFHITKSSVQSQSLLSWNSSVPTSSSASSDQGASITIDKDGNDHDGSNFAAELDTKNPIDELQTGIEKVVGTDTKNSPQNKESDRRPEEWACDIQDKSGEEPSLEVEFAKKSIICSKCDEFFETFEFSGGKLSLCPKCAAKDQSSTDQILSTQSREALPRTSENQGHNQFTNLCISESCERAHVGSDVADVAQYSETVPREFPKNLSTIESMCNYFQDSYPADCYGEKSEQNWWNNKEQSNTSDNSSEFHASASGFRLEDISAEGDVLPLALEESRNNEEIVSERWPHDATSVSRHCINTTKSSKFSSLNLVSREHRKSMSSAETFLKQNFVESINEPTGIHDFKVHVKDGKSSASFAANCSSPKQPEIKNQLVLPCLMDKQEYLESYQHPSLESEKNDLLLNLATRGNKREDNFEVCEDPCGKSLLDVRKQNEKALEKTYTWINEPAISIRDKQSGDCPEITVNPQLESTPTVTTNFKGKISANTFVCQKGQPNETIAFPPIRKSGTRKKSLSGLQDGSSPSMSNTPEKGKLLPRLGSVSINPDSDTSGETSFTIHDLGQRNSCRSLSVDEAADSTLSMGTDIENPQSSSHISSSSSVASKAAVIHPASKLLDRSAPDEGIHSCRTRPSQKQVKRASQEVRASEIRPKPPMVESKCNCTVM